MGRPERTDSETQRSDDGQPLPVVESQPVDEVSAPATVLEAEPLAAMVPDGRPQLIEAEEVDGMDGRLPSEVALLELEEVADTAPEPLSGAPVGALTEGGEEPPTADLEREAGVATSDVKSQAEPQPALPDREEVAGPAANGSRPAPELPPPAPAAAAATPADVERIEPRSGPRRRAGLVLIAAAAVLLILAGAGYALAHRSGQHPASAAKQRQQLSLGPSANWLFPPVAKRFDQVVLVLSNPARASSLARITLAGTKGAVVRRVRLPARAEAEMVLASPAAAGPIAVRATRNIVAQRVVVVGGRAQTELGQPVSVGGVAVSAAAGSALARKVWSFPVATSRSGRVLALTNPGSRPVRAAVVISSSGARLWQGDLAPRKQVSIQLPDQLKDGVTVRARAPILARLLATGKT